MLAQVVVNNEEKTVYTVPQGKSAFVYVDIFAPQVTSVSVKINDMLYYSNQAVDFLSVKLSLTTNDVVKVGSTGLVNVFVHGMEV